LRAIPALSVASRGGGRNREISRPSLTSVARPTALSYTKAIRPHSACSTKCGSHHTQSSSNPTRSWRKACRNKARAHHCNQARHLSGTRLVATGRVCRGNAVQSRIRLVRPSSGGSSLRGKRPALRNGCWVSWSWIFLPERGLFVGKSCQCMWAFAEVCRIKRSL
jgi:hypothetical protein